MGQSYGTISEGLSLSFLDRLSRTTVQTPEMIQTYLWIECPVRGPVEDKPQADMDFC